jgi:hypothetical protein
VGPSRKQQRIEGALETSWALETGWVCARGEIGVVQQRADVELAPETDNTQLACNQTTYTWHATDNIHLVYDSGG